MKFPDFLVNFQISWLFWSIFQIPWLFPVFYVAWQPWSHFYHSYHAIADKSKNIICFHQDRTTHNVTHFRQERRDMVICKVQQIEALKTPVCKIRRQDAREKCCSLNLIADISFCRTLIYQSYPWMYRYGTLSIL